MQRAAQSILALAVLLAGCDAPDEPDIATVEFAQPDLRLDSEVLHHASALAYELAELDPADADDKARIAGLSDELSGLLADTDRPTGLVADAAPKAGSLMCTVAYNLSLLGKAQAAAAWESATTNYSQVGGPYSADCYYDANSAGLNSTWGSVMAYHASSTAIHRAYAISYITNARADAADAAWSCNASFWWNGSTHAYDAWQESEDFEATADATLTFLNLCVPG